MVSSVVSRSVVYRGKNEGAVHMARSGQVNRVKGLKMEVQWAGQ